MKRHLRLFGPSMGAILIGAYIVQSHLLFGATGLRLKEDGLAMIALGTGVLFGARQCRVRNDVGHNVCEFAANEMCAHCLNNGRPNVAARPLIAKLTRFRA